MTTCARRGRPGRAGAGSRAATCCRTLSRLDGVFRRPLRYVFQSDHNQTVQALVAAGVGVALVPGLTMDPQDESTVLLELPTVILGEAFLSVLGLGPPAPTATWGNVAQEGLHFFRVWQMGVASAAIALFVLAANVLADRVHDALDPRRGDARRRK